MKITREIFDNGRKIVHVNYEKKDINRIKKLTESDAVEENGDSDVPSENPS